MVLEADVRKEMKISRDVCVKIFSVDAFLVGEFNFETMVNCWTAESAYSPILFGEGLCCGTREIITSLIVIGGTTHFFIMGRSDFVAM